MAKDRDEARTALAARGDREALLREALLDVGSWYRSDADEFHVVHRAINATEAVAAAWRREIEAGALERAGWEYPGCDVEQWLRERAAALRAGEGE